MIVALVPDLMDRSKVAAAARALDREVRFVTAGDLPAAAPGAGLVLVDLSRPGAVDAVRAVAATGGGDEDGTGAPTRPRPHLVGFGSHVDRELLAEAADAGCDEVLARSQLFGRLAEVLGVDPAG